MSGFGSRVRKRITPGALPVPQLIGQYYFRGDTTNGEWRSLNELGSDGRQFATPEHNYVKKEYCQDELHPGPPYRSGGPFVRTKIEIPHLVAQGIGSYVTTGPSHTIWGFGDTRYDGGFVYQGSNGWPGDAGIFANDWDNHPILIPDITDQGPKAWRKTAPRIEVGGLAVALAESRDIPGMLRQTSKAFHEAWRDISVRRTYRSTLKGRTLRTPRGVWSMQPHTAASNYLNTQFGWVPFLSDIGKLFDVYQNSKKYIDRITAENGMGVRKRKVLENKTTRTPVWAGNLNWTLPSFPYYAGQPGMFTRSPSATIELIEEIKTVGVGKFRYYRPEFDATHAGLYDSQLYTVQRHMAIHGLRVNPSNIYRAMPWTWLADWFGNVGDNVANFSSMVQDSMAAEYFFVMQRKKTQLALTQVLPFSSGDVTVRYVNKVDVMQRNGDVSPFGLSLDAPVTGFQLSILAALGLSSRK